MSEARGEQAENDAADGHGCHDGLEVRAGDGERVKTVNEGELREYQEIHIGDGDKADTLDSRVYFVVFSILIAPVAEEILFRGVLYPAIKQFGFPRSALWGTAVLFAAIHVNVPIFLPLLALGLALALLYEATNNLLATITAHGLFNAVNILVFYWNQNATHPLHK